MTGPHWLHAQKMLCHCTGSFCGQFWQFLDGGACTGEAGAAHPSDPTTTRLQAWRFSRPDVLANKQRGRRLQQQTPSCAMIRGTPLHKCSTEACFCRQAEGEEAAAADPSDPWLAREFRVKWKRWSYVHCSWDTLITLSQLGGFKRVTNYIKKADDLAAIRACVPGEHTSASGLRGMGRVKAAQGHAPRLHGCAVMCWHVGIVWRDPGVQSAQGLQHRAMLGTHLLLSALV